MVNTMPAAPQVKAGPEAPVGDSGRYLTFTLNGEAYALNIFHVTEIIEHRRLTVVPMMPEFVRGVINLRGRAVPVIDLAVRFARGATTIARRSSIVIVHINQPANGNDRPAPVGNGHPTMAGGQDIGILVDTVNKVVDFAADSIEPAPAFGAGIQADYISGMAKRDHDFILVLNIDRILSIDDLADLDTADVEAAAADPGETAQ